MYCEIKTTKSKTLGLGSVCILKKQAGGEEPQKELLGTYISDWEEERSSGKKLQEFKAKTRGI